MISSFFQIIFDYEQREYEWRTQGAETRAATIDARENQAKIFSKNLIPRHRDLVKVKRKQDLRPTEGTNYPRARRTHIFASLDISGAPIPCIIQAALVLLGHHRPMGGFRDNSNVAHDERRRGYITRRARPIMPLSYLKKIGVKGKCSS